MRRPDPVHEFIRFNSSRASRWLAHVVPWCTRFRSLADGATWVQGNMLA
jgi:hypothetical protein